MSIANYQLNDYLVSNHYPTANIKSFNALKNQLSVFYIYNNQDD